MIRSRTQERGGARTRQVILDVARELFAERGFSGTTVKNIAERCRISDAALYHHFPSKRRTLESLWESPRTGALQRPEPGEVLTRERLMELVDLQLEVTAEQDSLRRLLVREALAGDPLAVAMRNNIVSLWQHYWMRYLRTRFDDDEAARYCDALMGILQGATFQGQIDHGAAYPEVLMQPEYREWIKRMVCTAVPIPAQPGCPPDAASSGG